MNTFIATIVLESTYGTSTEEVEDFIRTAIKDTNFEYPTIPQLTIKKLEIK